MGGAFWDDRDGVGLRRSGRTRSFRFFAASDETKKDQAKRETQNGFHSGRLSTPFHKYNNIDRLAPARYPHAHHDWSATLRCLLPADVRDSRCLSDRRHTRPAHRATTSRRRNDRRRSARTVPLRPLFPGSAKATLPSRFTEDSLRWRATWRGSLHVSRGR